MADVVVPDLDSDLGAAQGLGRWVDQRVAAADPALAGVQCPQPASHVNSSDTPRSIVGMADICSAQVPSACAPQETLLPVDDVRKGSLQHVV